MERKREHLKLIQVLVGAGVVALIGVGFAVNVLGASRHNGVPERLLDMRVTDYVGGSQALQEVNQMHGVGIQMVDAIIAEYSHELSPYHNNEEHVTAWIGKTRTVEEAETLVDQMYRGIQQGKGNTPFSNVTIRNVDGRDVFQVDGPGGVHFFYVSSKPEPRVIWLSIYSGNTENVLKEALRSF